MGDIAKSNSIRNSNRYPILGGFRICSWLFMFSQKLWNYVSRWVFQKLRILITKCQEFNQIKIGMVKFLRDKSSRLMSTLISGRQITMRYVCQRLKTFRNLTRYQNFIMELSESLFGFCEGFCNYVNIWTSQIILWL